MKLIVGLGNPGREYEATRHNVGFRVADALHRKYQARWRLDRQLNAWYAQLPQSALMKPRTMMNDSGHAVAAAKRRWSLQPAQEVLIVCDDVNLPLGTMRMRPRGSDGGHHGLASCLAQLGTNAVPRLRVGVGVDPLPKDLADFVLSPFRNAERPLITQLVARAAEACEVWAADGIQAAMNQTNVREP